MREDRLSALRALLAENGLDAVIVSKYVNLHYFSGFRGDDTMLVITPQEALLVTDNRYTEQAGQQAPLFTVVEQKKGLLREVVACLAKLGVKKVGFEGNALIYNDYRRLQELVSGIDVSTPLNLDGLRQVKDEEEIRLIRRACEIADGAYEDIIRFIRPGMTEIEVAAHMENYMRQNGSEEPSFTTIVASGLRGSLPHGTASEKVIARGDFVTMDYGAVYQGYHSDITRTLCMGSATEKQRRVYSDVLQGQLLALEEIRPGASGVDVDKKVREFFATRGIDKYFGHGLGHSLGLEIHEEPRLSPHSKCEHLLPNMLITDEPGVYIPGWGGLRIEDTVLVTQDGCEPLTRSTKELIEIKR